MNIKEKLLAEFDKTVDTDAIKGFEYNDLLMTLHEFSDLYSVKKYILLKSLSKN